MLPKIPASKLVAIDLISFINVQVYSLCMKYEESLSEIVLNTECLPVQYCVCYVSLSKSVKCFLFPVIFCFVFGYGGVC